MAMKPGDPVQRAPVWVLPRIAGPMGLINSTVADVLTFAKMHMDKGKAYYEQANYDKARIEVRNVLQIDPKSAQKLPRTFTTRSFKPSP